MAVDASMAAACIKVTVIFLFLCVLSYFAEGPRREKGKGFTQQTQSAERRHASLTHTQEGDALVEDMPTVKACAPRRSTVAPSTDTPAALMKER